ncbi:MAG: BLUF domain-containing protein [Campylobacterales bacterium]|nr:BLUF domain-containing protein [Campylobacterales bacterium]
MIELIYVSSATKTMSEAELLGILEVSRIRNQEDGITGMLLYAGGNFFQVLEGEHSAVMATYNRILRDPRHKDCMVLTKNEIAQRSFPEWSMGFKYLGASGEELEGFSEFFNRSMKPEEIAQKPSVVIDLLYMFKRRNT